MGGWRVGNDIVRFTSRSSSFLTVNIGEKIPLCLQQVDGNMNHFEMLKHTVLFSETCPWGKVVNHSLT